MKRTANIKRTPLKPIGKKGRAWNNCRRGLKKLFAELYGITTCELGYAPCWRDNGLGFAHADKRRFLKPEDLSVVILVCNPCHDLLERKPRPVMRRIVLAVIAARMDKILNDIF